MKVQALTQASLTPISAALMTAVMMNAATAATGEATASTQEAGALLAACAKVSSDSMRLACFDELARGELPNALTPKRALDLSGTFKSAVAGNPHVVLVGEGEADVADEAIARTKAPADVSSAQTQTDDAITAPKLTADTDFSLPKSALGHYSPLSLAYDLDKNSDHGLWTARPHNANYILPLYMNLRPNRNPATPNQAAVSSSPNEMRIPELKFQVSLKTKAAENLFGTHADLWVGYTQRSHWQVYNEDHSRPFRAHDYEPEVFLTQPVAADLPFGGKLRMLGAGAVHHSNGESDPLSRSWNRVYLMAGAEWDNLIVMPRLWGRVLKKDGSKPNDNPDILDYYGFGDVKFLYRFDKGSNLSGLVRYHPKTQKGALQLDYVYPMYKGVSGYIQFFQGYGQSIIDYNHEASSVGVGVMLNDWMGL